MLVAVGFGHEQLDVLADDLGGRVTEQALRRRIHRLDQAVVIDGDDRVHGGLQDGAGACLAFFELADGLAEVGDVAGNPGEHAAVAQVQLADGQVHGEGAAVLTQADHLPADADDLLLAGVQVVLEIAIVFVSIGLGHEHFDVSADDLGGRVTEQPFRRRVHRLDGPAPLDGEDGIHGGVEDSTGPRLAILELMDGSAKVSDVAGDSGEHALLADLQLADGQVHGEHAAVLTQADDLPADADDLAVAGVQVVLEIAIVFVSIGIGHEHLDVSADDFGGLVTEQPFRRRVHRLDLPVIINGEDGIHGGVKDGPGAGLAIFQLSDGMIEIGDVASDAGKHAAVAQMQLADSQVHGERAGVLAQADHLPTDADDLLLSGLTIVLEVAIVFVAVGLGHEHLDVLPEDFGGLVTEQPLRGRVHRLDHPDLVDGDDCVHGGVEDGPGPSLAFEKCLLGNRSHGFICAHAFFLPSGSASSLPASC